MSLRSETYQTRGEEGTGPAAPTVQRVKAVRRASGRGRGAPTGEGVSTPRASDSISTPNRGDGPDSAHLHDEDLPRAHLPPLREPQRHPPSAGLEARVDPLLAQEHARAPRGSCDAE